ncbi:hypothetical protein SESBI_15460 [Sesbania bispinosa]|nr:hypothetical protein SESBI_15460 [Sesbania bispinosa]
MRENFPQPTRPLNSYDLVDYETEMPSNVPQREDIVGHQSNVDVVPPTTMAREKEEGETKFVLVDKLVNQVLDKYEKLKDQLNLEEMVAKEERYREGKSHTTSRGLQLPAENDKLERFKIRTVVAGEVVKEDQKK